MPKGNSRKATSRTRWGTVITLTLGFAFALVALVMTYRLLQQSTDNRSRAATDDVVIKRWEFEQNAEGWSTTGSGPRVANGMYSVAFPEQRGILTMTNSDSFAGNAPVSNKRLKIRIAAGGAAAGVLGAADTNGASSVIPNAPGWFSLIPEKLRNFLELLYLWVFVYKRPTDMAYLLEGITEGGACVQVIQAAMNRETGECREFPTPCDVPAGWEKVDSCTGSCTPRPPCADGVVDDLGHIRYCDPPSGVRWCPPNCTPRPACLDNDPACRIAETPDMCPPRGTVRLRLKLPNGSPDLDRRYYTVSLPIDGAQHEYELPITDQMTALALEFSRPMLTTPEQNGPYPSGSTTLAIDWIRVVSDPVRPTPQPPCVISGCNGELCLDRAAAADIGGTICLAKPEYACYRSAECKVQSDGKCGWTQTQELTSCLAQHATVCWNRVGEENEGNAKRYYWPNGCKGALISAEQACTQATVPLTATEVTGYLAWVAAGRHVPQGCDPGHRPTPTPTPPAGCHYQQVQCIQAPCDPVLVCPTTSCRNLWWFDTTHRTCTQKSFCGVYMYEGLRTFAEKADCEAALTDGNRPCVVTGCSGQICADQQLMSTCEYRPEYACYQQATCARQANGQCGWTQTDTLRACLENRSRASGETQ